MAHATAWLILVVAGLFGTAYAVWVGIGALGAAVLGVALFGEPVTLPRVAFLALLLVSIVGLRLTSSG